MMHFRPLKRGRALHVIEADEEHSRIKTFDFAGEVVAIGHHYDIGLFSRKERQSKQQYGTKSCGPDSHNDLRSVEASLGIA
jgi:hypothetical protein